MAKWLIFYGDNTTFSDQDGPPDQVPSNNVQVIAVEDEDCGRVLLNSKDYYWWTGNTWKTGDIFGLYDYLLQPGWKRVLFGRTIDNHEYQAILAKAGENNYLPSKSARRSWERN